jgi:hypothetical protein
LKLKFGLIRKSSTDIKGADSIEYAKMQFGARKEAFKEIKEMVRAGQESLLAEINKEIERYQKELEKLEAEFDTTEKKQSDVYTRTKDELTERGLP